MSCSGSPARSDHAAAVTRAGMRRGGREIGAAIAAGRQHHGLGRKPVDGAVIKVPRHHTRTHPVIGHDEVEREILDEKLRLVLQRLAIERVQDGVPGAVGGRAGALYRRAVAIILHVPAKRPLIDAPVLGARKRHAVMFKLIDRLGRLHGQILHGVDIAQPVRALDRVKQVPLPGIGRHVGQRGGNAALGGHGMAARRKHLGDAGGLQPLFGHAERGAQARAACPHHDNIKGVIDIGVGGIGHGQAPNAIFRSANTLAAPVKAQKKVDAMTSVTFRSGPCT